MSQLNKAGQALRNIVLRGGSVLFVGTKKQAKETIYRASTRCGMYYVNERWLGGTLTNNVTIRKSIGRLRELEAMSQDGTFEKLSKKEVARLLREKAKLHKYLDGIKNMDGLPKALFVVDTRRDKIAVAEARKMGVPVVAMVDSNSDPDPIDYPIPANDDAIKSVSLLSNVIADYIVEAQNEVYKTQPEAAPEKKRVARATPADVRTTRPPAREAAGVVEPEAPVTVTPEPQADTSSEEEQKSRPDTISEPTTEEKGN
jgi:small subunit ribosomal protein S2